MIYFRTTRQKTKTMMTMMTMMAIVHFNPINKLDFVFSIDVVWNRAYVFLKVNSSIFMYLYIW